MFAVVDFTHIIHGYFTGSGDTMALSSTSESTLKIMDHMNWYWWYYHGKTKRNETVIISYAWGILCVSITDDVIKWKHFPRYWPFVRGIHRSPVNSPHKGQWRGALMFSLICAWINGWVNNGEAGDLGRHRARYDVIVMSNPRLTFCS